MGWREDGKEGRCGGGETGGQGRQGKGETGRVCGEETGWKEDGSERRDMGCVRAGGSWGSWGAGEQRTTFLREVENKHEGAGRMLLERENVNPDQTNAQNDRTSLFLFVK